jgi:hypothetical protein
MNRDGFAPVLLVLLIAAIAIIAAGIWYYSRSTATVPALNNQNISPPLVAGSPSESPPLSPTTPTPAPSAAVSQDIIIHLQINGSAENSVSIKTGENAAITWDAKNATTCTSGGGGPNVWSNQARPASGSFVLSNVNVTGKTQFTLVCKNESKTANAIVTLNVAGNLSKIPQSPSPQPTPPAQLAPTPIVQPKQKILEKFATIVYDSSVNPTTGGAINFDNPVIIDSSRVIKKFYETHPDIYDFIAVYSIIPTKSQAGSGLTVKNGIQGNSSLYPNLDDTAIYGSNGKLLGSIFIPPGLGLDASANFDTLGVLAHEVSHHWILFIGDVSGCIDNPNLTVQCQNAPTGFRINKDGGHWSLNVDTATRENRQVYADPNGGSAWQISGSGYCQLVPVTGTGVRFNDIDMYLMGFIPPASTNPINWYDVDSNFNEKLGGQKCTQHTLSAQDVIGMAGERQPAYPNAERDFNLGLILLTAPGQTATQQEISKMNYIADNFSATWNTATRKISTMNIPLK